VLRDAAAEAGVTSKDKKKISHKKAQKAQRGIKFF
jgi:hypothetical protein